MKNSMSSIWDIIYDYESDKECKEQVQAMIDEGADITAEDNESVQLAAEYGHMEMVRLLIEHGADITANDNCAVKWAAENGHTEMVKFLLENGATLQE